MYHISYLPYFKSIVVNTITMNTNEEQERKIDMLNFWIEELVKYFNEIGFEVNPLPRIIFNTEHNDSDMLFIKTGYYQPDANELVLFIDGRHIKDILRTFCHEMVHRNQHIRDPQFASHTSNLPLEKDPILKKIESEAFLKGNLLFRGFTERYTH